MKKICYKKVQDSVSIPERTATSETSTFTIHHAGMNYANRATVEDLFAESHIQVLGCTTTLTWSVKLPAHAVVTERTQICNPEKAC